MTQIKVAESLASNFSNDVIKECSSLIYQYCPNILPFFFQTEQTYHDHLKYEVCYSILESSDLANKIKTSVSLTLGIISFSMELPNQDIKENSFAQVVDSFFRPRHERGTSPNLISRIVEDGSEIKLGDQPLIEVVSAIKSKNYKYSLLTVACLKGSSPSDKIVRGLLKGGSNPNEVDSSTGCSPLNFAGWSPKITIALLEKGAQKNRPCYDLSTPSDSVSFGKASRSEKTLEEYRQLFPDDQAELLNSEVTLINVGAKTYSDMGLLETAAWDIQHFCEKHLFCNR